MFRGPLCCESGHQVLLLFKCLPHPRSKAPPAREVAAPPHFLVGIGSNFKSEASLVCSSNAFVKSERPLGAFVLLLPGDVRFVAFAVYQLCSRVLLVFADEIRCAQTLGGNDDISARKVMHRHLVVLGRLPLAVLGYLNQPRTLMQIYVQGSTFEDGRPLFISKT